MYTQIFLGVWMLINAIFHALKVKSFIRKSLIANLSPAEAASYQKGFALPCFLLGAIIISMALVDHNELLTVVQFIFLYILLLISPFILLLRNNKKHSGYYFW